MDFKIRMGIPEMEYYWQDLTGKADKGELGKDELRTFKNFLKVFTTFLPIPNIPA